MDQVLEKVERREARLREGLDQEDFAAVQSAYDGYSSAVREFLSAMVIDRVLSDTAAGRVYKNNTQKQREEVEKRETEIVTCIHTKDWIKMRKAFDDYFNAMHALFSALISDRVSSDRSASVHSTPSNNVSSNPAPGA